MTAACSSGSGSGPGAGSSSTTSPVPVAAARFEPAACPADVSDVAAVRCGHLVVPERRDRRTSGVVRLFVTILPSRGPAREPVLVLQGGPGVTPDLATFVDHPLRDGHEVVILDQRGTGRSRPTLACPELSRANYETLGADADAPRTRARIVTAARACHDRLRNAGIDLAAYNTAENANDVADLRRALRIESWDLVGNSYGSRLAFTVVRDHPEGVRALGISGAYPPDKNTFDDIGDATADAFDALFASRAGLKAKFVELLGRLERSPVRVTASLADGSPLDVLFDGENLVTFIREGLYQSELIPLLPVIIERLWRGEGFDAVAAIVAEEAPAEIDAANFSFGLFYSVQCQEDFASRDPETERAALGRYPSLGIVTSFGYPHAEICEIWDLAPQPSSIRRPVESDVPVAMFTGALDPATPPEWTRSAAANLAHGYHFILPGYGHDTTALPCPRAARNAFFADPTRSPDTSCLHAPPTE
jgi:pimeloyl-ACP methyl ester carboxylesterase